jgi:hypothetical protein
VVARLQNFALNLLFVFWIFDEVWWAGDNVATVATTSVEADFIGVMTNAATQTFINIWKIQKTKN